MAAEGVTIGTMLRAAGARIDRVDARILLGHVLARPASYLVAHPEQVLAVDAAARFDALVSRRAAGEPVAYLVGAREFYGRVFAVDASVLIPRPETELVVDVAKSCFPAAPARVLDLGAGSGALAVTLACEWPTAEVLAVDRSAAALTVARRNAERLGARVEFVSSDWFGALDAHWPFDLIVSNPPYIRVQDPHLARGDVRFEPQTALVAGADGLDDIRRIVCDAPAHLCPGGWLLLEHGYDQAADVRALLGDGPYVDIRSWRDIAGIERVTGARLDETAGRA